MRHFLKRVRDNDTGTTAVEFAMIAPVFVALLIGTLTLCVGLLLVGSLHYAVEEGARCASIKTTICSDSASTIAYAQSHYFGPSLSPSFTSNFAAPCGKSVTASISYSMNVGSRTLVIPISATSCFP